MELFEQNMLMEDQVELLRQIAEAARNVPMDQRERFMYRKTLNAPPFLMHRRLAGRTLSAYEGDLDALCDTGLFRVTYGSTGTAFYDVTPIGYKYCEYLQQKMGQAIEQVEFGIQRFLNSEDFQRRHPIAFQKWQNGAERLWSSDSQADWTTIGHLCREAVQEFAEDLIHQFRPPEALKDKAKTIARIRAVLALQEDLPWHRRRTLLGCSVGVLEDCE
jgi:hypothetical protein